MYIGKYRRTWEQRRGVRFRTGGRTVRGVAGIEYVNLRNRNGRDKYMPVDCIVINEARNNINASPGDVV